MHSKPSPVDTETPAVAKVFTSGNSQAVRLPKAFRVDTEEVWISKNPLTQEITIRPKLDEADRKKQIAELMQMLKDAQPFPDDFLSPESRLYDEPRNPFEDWDEK